MILNTILEAIGKTPVVRLQRIGKSLPCELYAKCEFLNPGGSMKDRAAYHMVLMAEREGRIKPGDTLIEPTSGNTGIGLALVGAVRGYRVIITMSDKISANKEMLLRALGATVYRTPKSAKWDSPDSNISLAKRLQQEIPQSHILDQYTNPANPNAHYLYTATEIIEDFGSTLSMVVIGVGTGGTITGVARHLKEMNPSIQMIAVDPYGSILGGGTSAPYLVEGIGYDFYPDVLDIHLIDEMIKVHDRDSFLMARRLIREEGLLVGGSSGTTVYGALQAAARLKQGEKCLVLLPDSIRNYFSTFINDDWMRAEGLLDESVTST